MHQGFNVSNSREGSALIVLAMRHRLLWRAAFMMFALSARCFVFSVAFYRCLCRENRLLSAVIYFRLPLAFDRRVFHRCVFHCRFLSIATDFLSPLTFYRRLFAIVSYFPLPLTFLVSLILRTLTPRDTRGFFCTRTSLYYAFRTAFQ